MAKIDLVSLIGPKISDLIEFRDRRIGNSQEGEGVRTGAAPHLIGACTTGQYVVSSIAPQAVIAATAENLVVADAGLGDVVTRATLDGVAESRGQRLPRHGGAGDNVDDVVLRRADDRDADVFELGNAHGLVGELQEFDSTQGIRPVGRAGSQIEDLKLTATGIGNQVV